MVTGAENSGGSILKARDYKLGHSPLSAVLAKVRLRRRTLAKKILRRRTSVFRTKAYGPRQVLAWSHIPLSPQRTYVRMASRLCPASRS